MKLRRATPWKSTMWTQWTQWTVISVRSPRAVGRELCTMCTRFFRVHNSGDLRLPPPQQSAAIDRSSQDDIDRPSETEPFEIRRITDQQADHFGMQRRLVTDLERHMMRLTAVYESLQPLLTRLNALSLDK